MRDGELYRMVLDIRDLKRRVEELEKRDVPKPSAEELNASAPRPPAELLDAHNGPIGTTSGRLLKATPLRRFREVSGLTCCPCPISAHGSDGCEVCTECECCGAPTGDGKEGT